METELSGIPKEWVIGQWPAPNLLETWCHCSCGWVSECIVGIYGKDYVQNEGHRHLADQLPGYKHRLRICEKWSYVENKS